MSSPAFIIYFISRVIVLFSFADPIAPYVNASRNTTVHLDPDRKPISVTAGDKVITLSNTSVTVKCVAGGLPTPSMTWVKDNKKIPKGGRVTHKSGTLSILKGQQNDTGLYTCFASNQAGDNSVTSNITFKGKVTIRF